jgi:hypothetical protein
VSIQATPNAQDIPAHGAFLNPAGDTTPTAAKQQGGPHLAMSAQTLNRKKVWSEQLGGLRPSETHWQHSLQSFRGRTAPPKTSLLLLLPL